MNHEENISGLENDSKHSYLLENFIDNFHSFDKNKKKKGKHKHWYQKLNLSVKQHASYQP